jgi:hypothetical protein
MKAAGLKGMAMVKRRAHANKAAAGVNQAASHAAILGASQFPATAGEGQNPKLETRNPKSEGNPKSEIRIVAEPQSAGPLPFS